MAELEELTDDYKKASCDLLLKTKYFNICQMYFRLCKILQSLTLYQILVSPKLDS